MYSRHDALRFAALLALLLPAFVAAQWATPGSVASTKRDLIQSIEDGRQNQAVYRRVRTLPSYRRDIERLIFQKAKSNKENPGSIYLPKQKEYIEDTHALHEVSERFDAMSDKLRNVEMQYLYLRVLVFGPDDNPLPEWLPPYHMEQEALDKIKEATLSKISWLRQRAARVIDEDLKEYLEYLVTEGYIDQRAARHYLTIPW